MLPTKEKIKTLEDEIHQLSIALEAKKVELQKLQNSNEKAPANNESLTNSEISRFSRQIILSEIGVRGQIRLKNAKVLIVGGGGLGKCSFQQFSMNNIH